ncbi:MAG TPA: DUF3667 domain-containing protein [Casimicrobiaceae bacterium]|nr:DUF3667 domain-containing protein [Casimicrobiaceae bacterium]
MTSATSPAAPARVCANCGAVAPGSYCPDCGQETRIELPTVRAFMRDAAGRYVALDGRSLRTVRDLLFRPGFLTREYLAGRRRQYVRPGRLFLVLSLAMFAVLRIANHDPSVQVIRGDDVAAPGSKAPQHATQQDGFSFDVTSDLDIELATPRSAWLAPLQRDIDRYNALTVAEKRRQISAGLFRYGPYAAIAMLPVFALLLKLSYARRVRQYPNRPHRYAAHLVFSAYSHAFLFVLAILFAVVPAWLQFPLFLWGAFYVPVSMKRVYGGRWSGVVARTAVVGAIYFAVLVVAFVGTLIAAILLS